MAPQLDRPSLRLMLFYRFLYSLASLPFLSARRREKFRRSAAKRQMQFEKQILRNGSFPPVKSTAYWSGAVSPQRSVFQQDIVLRLENGFETDLRTDLDPRMAIQRILVVCPIPPTVNHAGGLRQIDMLHRIKRQNARNYIELFTRSNIGDCGPLGTISQVVDKVTIAPYDDLSIDEYLRLSPVREYFDVVDFQFPMDPKRIAAYRVIGRKLIFTPMESHIRNEALVRGVKNLKGTDLKTSDALTELRICQLVDQTVCVSNTDRAAIAAACDADVIAIETGVSDIEFAGQIVPINPSNLAVCYVAYFGSPTNREALKWYLDLVHPQVLSAVKDYEFRIIGRGDVAEIIADRPTGIRHVGEVDRIGPHVKASLVGIAPALSGSGFRGKINQYAHLGLPTVASRLASDGMAYVDGQSIMAADSPEEFADRIITLLRDPHRARSMGAAAAEVCRRVYGWDAKFPAIAQVYDLPESADAIAMPSVHAVVPSYMHGKFIEERIRSIFAQQYPNFRVTVIDDHSTDNSDSLISSLRSEFKFDYIRRKKNSGTPFSAWKYAAENTTEDFIWICESDDAAEPMLLANLVRQMSLRKGMAVAYCGSWVVDERGDRIETTADYSARQFHPTRWQEPFIARGHHELQQFLRFGMVVPNMSSALIAAEVFRKAFTPDVMDFRLAGDWLFIGQAMLYGDIAYIPDCLNRFRHHSQTSRNQTARARRSAEHICVRLKLSELAGAGIEDACTAVRYDLRELAADTVLADEVRDELLRIDPVRSAQWDLLLMDYKVAIKNESRM